MNYINILLKESIKAAKRGNVPVSALIVRKNKIIAKAYNTKNSSKIAVNHAEIICIKKACKKLKSWHLDDCEIYVTLKPCDMCAHAIAESRIKKVYYLVESHYKENALKNYKKVSFNKIKTKNKEYKEILSNFFKNIRDYD